jgi:hypothetical protein
MDFVKCLAKRSLAYLEGTTQRCNVEWLIDICESQMLRLFDEVATWIIFPRRGRFRRSRDPLTRGHQTPERRKNAVNEITGRNTTTTGRSSDIVPWGNRRASGGIQRWVGRLVQR